MNNRTKYLLILVVVTVGLYVAEQYVNARPSNDTTTTTSNGHINTVMAAWLPISTTGDVVHRNHYSFSYNEAAEQAEWVAYWLAEEQVVNNNFDRPYFEQDPMVKTQSADWRNYKSSGYDRGHLCPAADMEFDYDAFKDTFYTSNISPQLHDFNAGVWNYLEQRVRKWAKQNSGVFVVTGGVLMNPITTIGQEQVAVPNAFYKIVVDTHRDEFRAIAFLIPHSKNSTHYSDYITTIDQIELATGIDFFASLPENQQANLETRIDRLYFDF